MTRPRVPWPAVAATVSAAAVLGAVPVVLAASWGDLRHPGTGAWDVGAALRLWATVSAIALPVGFVFGMLALVVIRALRRRAR